LAELNPTNLSCERLGKLGHEFDKARVRVGGEAMAYVALDLIGQRV
jgi:hypothetical protein